MTSINVIWSSHTLMMPETKVLNTSSSEMLRNSQPNKEITKWYQRIIHVYIFSSLEICRFFYHIRFSVILLWKCYALKKMRHFKHAHKYVCEWTLLFVQTIFWNTPSIQFRLLDEAVNGPWLTSFIRLRFHLFEGSRFHFVKQP